MRRVCGVRKLNDTISIWNNLNTVYIFIERNKANRSARTSVANWFQYVCLQQSIAPNYFSTDGVRRILWSFTHSLQLCINQTFFYRLFFINNTYRYNKENQFFYRWKLIIYSWKDYKSRFPSIQYISWKLWRPYFPVTELFYLFIY